MKMFFLILTPTYLELEVYQFAWESDVKMPFYPTCARQNTLDWIYPFIRVHYSVQ